MVHAASRRFRMKYPYEFCASDLMLNFQLKFLENSLHQTTVSNSLTGLDEASTNN